MRYSDSEISSDSDVIYQNRLKVLHTRTNVLRKQTFRLISKISSLQFQYYINHSNSD